MIHRSHHPLDARPGRLLGLTLLAAGALVLGACDGGEELAGTTTERHAYAVGLEAGHAHVFAEEEVIFTVYDMDHCADPEDASTCETVAGLPVEATYRSPHGDEMRVQDMDGANLVGNGDGTYTWHRSFDELGTWTVGLQFEDGGHVYADAFPMGTSKAGGEGFTCDADEDGAADRVYQIRWHVSDGHMHADGEEVHFQAELQRSFNETIDLEEPWTNLFDHLRPSELDGGAPVIELMHGQGDAAEVEATLEPAYQGEGRYAVAHAFTEEAVGHDEGGDFWLRVTLTDDLGCTVQGASEAEEFRFHVSSPH